jgi:hypothetical protein
MLTTAQEIYIQSIRSLPETERLRLAAIILQEMAIPQRQPLTEFERKEALAQLLRHAGAVSSGNPRAADNQQIEADLAREYNKDL